MLFCIRFNPKGVSKSDVGWLAVRNDRPFLTHDVESAKTWRSPASAIAFWNRVLPSPVDYCDYFAVESYFPNDDNPDFEPLIF